MKDAMNKIIAVIILATGIVLLVLGIGALNSFTSDISRMLTGVPTDRSTKNRENPLALAMGRKAGI
jgi:multisubunit Na+/H+ antiporter MnhC subunit